MRLLVLFLALYGGGASAVVLKPDANEIAAAARAGTELARPVGGYRLQDHVVYAVKDARAIDPADGDVDAVVLATPLERTRHAAYFAAHGGEHIGSGEARRRAELADGQIRIIVFAHGANETDQGFAQGFGPAHLVIGGQGIDAPAIGGDPSETVYPLATTGRNRFAATITYQFDVSRLPGAATARAVLSFTDASGKAFQLPVDMAAFQ